MLPRSAPAATRCSRTLLAVVLLLSGIVLPATTHAATITVTSIQQEQPFVTNGNCTLGEAIQAANTDTAVDACPAGNGADMITLAADATYVLTASFEIFIKWIFTHHQRDHDSGL